MLGKGSLVWKSACHPHGLHALTHQRTANGIRALGKLLINYRGKDGMPGVGGPGIDTVRETITRWAPGNENNTEAYIAAVARRLGVNANDVIDVRKPATLGVMVSSIIAHECAGFAYPEAVLAEGLRRALS